MLSGSSVTTTGSDNKYVSRMARERNNSRPTGQCPTISIVGVVKSLTIWPREFKGQVLKKSGSNFI
jgi:hypothetical protein